jgi:hypothetical protein
MRAFVALFTITGPQALSGRLQPLSGVRRQLLTRCYHSRLARSYSWEWQFTSLPTDQLVRQIELILEVAEKVESQQPVVNVLVADVVEDGNLKG